MSAPFNGMSLGWNGLPANGEADYYADVFTTNGSWGHLFWQNKNSTGSNNFVPLGGFKQNGDWYSGTLNVTNPTPTGSGSDLGLGTTTGIGNGTGVFISAPAKGTGSGPTAAGTVVKWLELDLGGTKYWLPLFQ